MEKNKLQTLLDIAQNNKFCIKDEKNNFSPILPDVKGQVVEVISLIAKEIFGNWPLSEDQAKQFKILTNLKYRPTAQKSKLKTA